MAKGKVVKKVVADSDVESKVETAPVEVEKQEVAVVDVQPPQWSSDLEQHPKFAKFKTKKDGE